MDVSQGETSPSNTPRIDGKEASKPVELWNASSPTTVSAVQGTKRARISSRVPTVATVESAGHETPIPQLAKSTVEFEAPIPQLDAPNSTVGALTVSSDGTPDDPDDAPDLPGDGDARGRVFTIQTALVHPVSGRQIVTADEVDAATHRKGVSKAAWIVHDRDIHTTASAARSAEPHAREGGVKNTHAHIVEAHPNVATVTSVAKAYGIEERFVRVAKGRKAFDLCCQYLTHEHPHQRGHGKELYERDEVRFHGFDFATTLDALAEEQAAKAAKEKLTDVDELAMSVLTEGMTVAEAREADPLAFSRGRDRIRKMRSEYLDKQPPPASRINFYIHGPGGIGKDLLAKALARVLAADEVAAGRQPYFTVGGDNVGFEGYDGEPVVIWEDARPGKMIRAVGGRGDLFSVLNPYPERVAVNVKHSSTQLVNRINIISGPDDHETFLNALAGEYTDKFGTAHRAENADQAWRRFPIIIPVREDEFDLLVNRGFLHGTREFREFEHYRNLRQNMQKGLRRLEVISDPAIKARGQRELEQRTTAPVVEQYERITSRRADDDGQDDETKLAEVLAEFEDVGTAVSRTDADVQADQRKARLDQAEMRTRCQAQADGHTAHLIVSGRASRQVAVEDANTPSGWAIDDGGAPDMGLWDADAQTYNGQPARGWSDVSDDFKWPADVRREGFA